ncbi:MAG: hypothetical protein KDC36_08500 [Thermoleophilia bacterium]|nr:hypothetical protein [Thermoleophilia bacterium]
MADPRPQLFVHVADPGYGPGVDPRPREGQADVEVSVEPVDWAPLTPAPQPTSELVFIDGTQQIEAWLTVTDPADGQPITGAAFAVAAGAVRAGHAPRAEIVDVVVRRATIIEGDRRLRLPDTGAFRWEARSGASRDPNAISGRIGQLRSELELKLADRWSAPDRLLILDGRLSFVRDGHGPVVGAVKSHHTLYLNGEPGAVVARLAVGQRTPLFAIGEDRFSWYQRLPGVGTQGWAGILRGETPRSLGLETARRLADRATLELPRFAGRAHRDPRAPQNLTPIMTLESRLRHRMGDRALALRAARRAAAHAELDHVGTPAAADSPDRLHVAA